MGTHTVVIGGGFAGIAAATALAERNIPVTLIEKRPFLGGRTISIRHRQTGDFIDNGQHAMMGCYHQTFELLKRLGTLDGIHFQDTLTASYRGNNGFADRLQCPHLPGPFHLAFGLWRMKSFGWRDLLAASRMQKALQNPYPGETVEQLCQRTNQPESLVKLMWHPIALSALNETVDQADGRLFAEVMKQAFFGKAADSRLALPSVPLQELHGEHAIRFIQRHGGDVLLGQSVERINHRNDRVESITLRGGRTISCKSVITAVPQPATEKLFERSGLNQVVPTKPMGSSPILSTYLWFEKPVHEEAVCCLIDRHYEWIFHRNRFMRPGEHKMHCVCLVISAARQLMSRTRGELVRMALEDLYEVYPAAKNEPPVASHVFWERHATFRATPERAGRRPSHRTAIENLFLAGDWTDTSLPATIEGAVQSGHRCADAIVYS